jgi:hypothetical protein
MTDKFIQPLTKAISGFTGLEERFKDVFVSDDYISDGYDAHSSVYKLNYLPQTQRSIQRALLIETLHVLERPPEWQ